MKKIILVLTAMAMVSIAFAQEQGTVPMRALRDSSGIFVTVPPGKPISFIGPLTGKAGHLTRNATAPQSGWLTPVTSTDTMQLARLILGTATNSIHTQAIGVGANDFGGLNIVRTDKNANRSTQAQATDTSSFSVSFTQSTGQPQILMTDKDGLALVKIDSIGRMIIAYSVVSPSVVATNAASGFSTNLVQQYAAVTEGTVGLAIKTIAQNSHINLTPHGTGKVGIVTTTPEATLDITGNLAVGKAQNSVLYPFKLEKFNGDSVATIDTTGIYKSRGKMGEISGYGTAGTFGVPVVIDTVVWSAQTAAISAKNFDSTLTVGMYEVSCYAECTTLSGSGSPTLTVTIGWTDDVGATTSNIVNALSLSATGRSTNQLFVYSKGTAAITWLTTIASAAGTPQYALRMALKKLSN